ncbi:MAG: CBS domain-containing protein [Spirochaetaceae bacterium]|jgi:tRNA nucleotidyltransferase (CCA-adding enzyme)|nr:CBS domain-containing protein [Spirochaetaceae bacterium]
MDLDCLGSLILVKKLFPGYKLIRSRLIHPTAQGLYTMYEKYFDFLNPQDIKTERIDHIIIVDTSSADRVKEFFNCLHNSDPEITVYDHHPGETCNILGADLAGHPWGANTTCMAKLAMERGLALESEEATIALTGIYADTGRLIYENVGREDMEASAWLLDQGASLRLVKSFLDTVKEDYQMQVLNQLLLLIRTKVMQGHEVLLSYLELEENIPGLALVVEKIMDIENPDAYFAVFFVRRNNTVMVIARSQERRINLHKLLGFYGGGGHQHASSVTLRNQEGPLFYEQFLEYLEASLVPATCAGDIMTRKVFSVNENSPILDASKYMEAVNHTGLPVLDGGGRLMGFISLRDIMKARRASCMQAPVKAYMSRNIISSHPGITMREVERLFYKHHIGHLPILEDSRLVGIVTRWDFLEYKKRRKGPDAGENR